MSAILPTTLSSILGQSAETHSPPAAVNIGGCCPECRGKGYITLLVSHARCAACNGSGRAAGELDQHVATIGLSIRAIHGLAGIGIRTLRQAARLSDRELLSASGMDASGLDKLKAAMRRLGIRYNTAA
jgi:hypothetical protein